MCLVLERYEEALMDYEMASKLAPTNPKYYHSLGLCYESDGRSMSKDEPDLPLHSQDDQLELYNRAAGMYMKAVSLDEEFIESRYHLGIMLFHIKEYTSALKHLSMVHKDLPDDQSVLLRRGIVY
mmetsp:Transcript_31309/g.22681  ORF Transcript_31309/g.22681 Transcript_31309/m.22681 type:complete len:125 (+) Transcript_31309:140-514(+)|eukprot:CAMPEP_0116889382 /NCGR_PEP_ID=MMETSP0463-20121206/24824_1 /TAXON_ID=181622 /ORGANISM="Strombidinopsis sp, Strain SopsisLIS2011" /LENGTH=124 /DNA_ID=CAMNT_0004555931 /DNA_START=124 /DNA_END=498 /DNA_ORIENTATION=-